MRMEKVGETTFTKALLTHGSWGWRDEGTHPSTMTLYLSADCMRGCIEWDIPALDTVEDIGLWFDENRTLVDYDGIMALPSEAVALLKSFNFNIEEDTE